MVGGRKKKMKGRRNARFWFGEEEREKRERQRKD